MDEIPSSRRYEPRSVNLKDKNNSHALIVELVGRNNIILEVGTSTGYLTRIFRDLGNRVIGIEIDEEAAEVAEGYCDLMITGDVEELDLDEYLGPSSIDVAVFGDLLEHLKYPSKLLKKIKRYLRPQGRIVVSIPNVCHGDVLISLLKGDFRYTSMGLLDETHLRFFGLKNVFDLLADSGYSVEEVRTTRHPVGETELRREPEEVPGEIRRFIEGLPNSDVYQFVLLARPSADPKSPPVPAADLRAIFDRSVEDLLREHEEPLRREVAEAMAKSQEASERVRVLSQDISERDGRIAGLLGDLEEARERARSLDKAVSEREGRIAGLLGDLEEAGERSRSLDQAVSEREGRIGELLGDLEEARERSRSLDQAVSERERKNQAITEELKQSRNCAKKLDQKVLEQDKRISILNEEVQKINERALSLELMMSEKDGRIAALIEQLNQSENRALWLENEISDMRRSVVWTLTMKYHNTFVERLLPTNTRKRNCYDRGIKGLRIIVNEGWGLFWCKFNEYRGSRKYTEDIEASIEERILNHSKNILSENNQISQESTKYGSSAISNPEYFLKDYIRSRLLSFLSETSNELQFAKYEYPIVSIIILTYNKVGYTFQCLESILSNTDMEYEVIIVDNGSSDETTNLLNKLLNINVIRNDDNLGFILGCNMGASVSKGRYLLFLNNDIVVTPRWLSKLVNTIESNSSIGAVGCKLIWPNGLLQEAGSIIWSDGSALGYGRGDNPLSPEYSYIRRVDYCSGACLLVRRDVFEGLGGFDERYIPAYYEDSDLCIAIQESGYDVVYQPNVTVFHHEFTSSSPENAKKLMESNRLKFVEKWGNVLETKYFPSLDNVISARDVSQRPKILVLDDRIPAPYQGSGFPRAYEMLRIISELGFKTTFYPLDKTIPWQPATNELQQAGIEVIYGERLAFTEFAKERSNFYDIVLVSRPHNMEKTLPVIKDYFPRAKLVYDAEAIFSTREILKASVRGSSLDKTQIENMVSKEMNLMENADLVITVSEREKKTIEERGYLKPVGVWGHSIIPKNTESGFHERRDLLFVGSFLASDSPNEDAILYFVKEIFPTIKKEISCRLFIVGINPPESVKKLASSSIIVTGYVDDITEYYEKCRVFVVPHRFSAGIPLKLEEAMSYGIPAVVSELTASQLNLVDGHEVLVAKDADEFAKKIIKLYKNEDLWNLIRSNSLKSIQIRCNPILMEQKLKQILEGIV